MDRRPPYRRFNVLLLLVVALAAATALLPATSGAEDGPAVAGIYRGVQIAVKFDISPPLRSIPPKEWHPDGTHREIADDFPGPPGPLGPQDTDLRVQSEVGGGEIPAPVISFDGLPNVFGVSPPDPVGDVGPDH